MVTNALVQFLASNGTISSISGIYFHRTEMQTMSGVLLIVLRQAHHFCINLLHVSKQLLDGITNFYLLPTSVVLSETTNILIFV